MNPARMTAEQYRALTGAKRANKYRAVKTETDGITFDSQAEARRYGELKLLLRAGEIAGFNRQPSFLFESGTRYRPDFIVFGADGSVWVEDVKGAETQAFKLKRKLWEHEYPRLPLRVVKG